MSANESWRSRIGADPWKACIAEESWLIPADSENAWEFPPAGAEGTRVDGNGGYDASFWVKNIRDNQGKATDSYHVFQAGRHFLVEPREAVVNQFIDEAGNKPCHIVMLRWAPETWKGLTTICPVSKCNDQEKRKANEAADSPQARKVTIWTSNWVWEEALHSRGDLDPRGDLQLPDFPCLSPHDAEAELAQRRPNLANKVILFDQHLRLDLATGVSIYLDYVPSDMPSLRVAFRCNHLHMAIDPYQKS